MVINELYTLIVSLLKHYGYIDWPWSAILFPELVWLVIYPINIIVILVAVKNAKNEPPTREEWKAESELWD